MLRASPYAVDRRFVLLVRPLLHSGHPVYFTQDFSVRPDDTPDKILVQGEWVKGVSKAAATDEVPLMSDSKVVAERFAMVRETDLKGATALPTTATKDLVNAYLMQGETIVTSIDVIAFNNVNGKNMVGRQGVLFITASSQGHHKLKVIMMSETNQVNISESGMRKHSDIIGTEQTLLKQVSAKHTLDGFFTTIDLCKVRDSWRARSPHQHAPPHPTSSLLSASTASSAPLGCGSRARREDL